MTFLLPLTSYYGCATVLPWWPSYPLILLPSYSMPRSKTHVLCLCHCFILEHFVTFSFHWAILLLFPSSEGSYWPFSITLSHCSTYCPLPLSLTTTPFSYPMPLPCPTPYPIILLYRCAAPYVPLPFHCPMWQFHHYDIFQRKSELEHELRNLYWLNSGIGYTQNNPEHDCLIDLLFQFWNKKMYVYSKQSFPRSSGAECLE